jgi:putative hydrolase of the HAD superfamily
MIDHMKYQAVIFDLFGTLIDKFSLREHRSILRQMASVVSVPPDDFVRLWFDTFNERGLGVFPTLEANIKYICHQLGVPPQENQTRLAARINLDYAARAMKPRPYAAGLLSHLKLNGFKTGIITNCSASIPDLLKNMPFAPYIDVSVFSSLIGIQKPDPRIYQLTAEKLAVEPDKCLYIGDGDSQELTGASQVGMHPVLLRLPDEDSTDVHRVDSEVANWHGPTISLLKDVLTLLE